MAEILSSLILKLKEIKERKGLIQVIYNMGWLLLDKVLRLGIGLFIGLWVARYLGPSDYGSLNYVTAYISIFSVLASIGIDSILVRDIIKNPENKNALVGSAFFLKVIGGAVSFILSVLIVISFKKEDEIILILTFIVSGTLLFQAFDVIDYFFQAKVLSKYAVISRNLSFLITSFLRLLIILYQLPIIFFAYTSLLEILFSSIFLIFCYHYNRENIFMWKVKKDEVRQLLTDSWPMILSGLAIMVYMRIDQIMIGEILGEKEVGIYSAAIKISEIGYFLPIIISSSILPKIISIKNEGSLYLKRFQKLYDIMSILSFSIGILTSLFSKLIITFLFGPDYIDASSVLSIHIWTGVFVFLGVASGQFLIAENLTKYSFYRTLIGALINILLNFILIPLLEGIGAALATLIAQIFVVFSLVLFKKTRSHTILLIKSLLPFKRILFNKY